MFTNFKSLSDLFRFLEATNHVANLSRLMEHFRSRFWGLASLSFSFMMDTELEEEVDESEEISGAWSMMIVVTLWMPDLLAENVSAVSAWTYKTN